MTKLDSHVTQQPSFKKSASFKKKKNKEKKTKRI